MRIFITISKKRIVIKSSDNIPELKRICSRVLRTLEEMGYDHTVRWYFDWKVVLKNSQWNHEFVFNTDWNLVETNLDFNEEIIKIKRQIKKLMVLHGKINNFLSNNDIIYEDKV